MADLNFDFQRLEAVPPMNRLNGEEAALVFAFAQAAAMKRIADGLELAVATMEAINARLEEIGEKLSKIAEAAEDWT
ncbi:hypothetical protein [Bradyrhizobium cenepequi]|uniref:hypothetical protein n=1 Tax=Bradyrhizobium cenepequi TaxID=2821403 RepID=UPI001CE3B041|nr:hypothetical protein [Bradyrhizobium cenepequi]MCA6108118.1 hypothetical protein [Bradyrhizobium cenepequi]